MRLKAYMFPLIIFMVVATTYYNNSVLERPSVNDQIGVWDNPTRTNNRYTVISRSAETGGEYYVIEHVIRDGAEGFESGKPGSMPRLALKLQEKTIEVVEGVLTYEVNGTTATADVGDKVVVPKGAMHQVWNGHYANLVLRVTLRPGLPNEKFYENLAGLGRQMDGISNVHPVQLALLFLEGQMTLDLDPRLWRAVELIIPYMAKAFNFRAAYAQYRTLAGTPRHPIEDALPAQDKKAGRRAEQPEAAGDDADEAEDAAQQGEQPEAVPEPELAAAEQQEQQAEASTAGEAEVAAGQVAAEPLLEVDAAHMGVA